SVRRDSHRGSRVDGPDIENRARIWGKGHRREWQKRVSRLPYKSRRRMDPLHGYARIIDGRTGCELIRVETAARRLLRSQRAFAVLPRGDSVGLGGKAR